MNEVQRVVINQIYSLRKFTQNIFFFSQTNVENFSSLKNPVKLLILQTIRIPKDQLQYFKRYEKSAKSCRFVQLPLTHDLEILDPEIVPVNFGSKKLWNNLSGPLIVSLHLFINIINPTSVCLHPLHNLFWTKSWPVPFFVVFYKINLVIFTNSNIINMYYHRFKRRKGQ